MLEDFFWMCMEYVTSSRYNFSWIWEIMPLYGSNCRVLKGSDFWNSYIGILCIKKGLMKKKIMWTEKTPIVYIKNKTVVYLTLL